MAWTRGRILGRGSSATVSLALHRQSSEVFAVKSAELSRSEFLQREQGILSQINSPHIVGYVGCDFTNENGQLLYNIFIEYISGGTLTDVIRDRGGRLHESEIRSHTRSILQGLDYLHSHGLVHCDIKGRNILVGENGAKIVDFGCARWVGEQAPAMPIAGTPLFMAPEVARGEEQSFPVDIWALGCTVIEMATGRPVGSEFLQREQSILSLINCPRIVGYVGCDITNENSHLLYNLFIEYISRGTITDAIRDPGGHLHGVEMSWLETMEPKLLTSVVRDGLGRRLSCTVIEMATGRPPWPDVADPVSGLHQIGLLKSLLSTHFSRKNALYK
ncbi:hypothetical protein NE237_001736 [Protea cynaroides]|uniref:Protein kinase domain-containing protein n=1 Tax=Protea cynaroides TaxID=273540 RepID=A0A9Q0QYE0_9MAGN|nr:hypothetical protein NE237_001736 [Protea cynaroides]